MQPTCRVQKDELKQRRFPPAAISGSRALKGIPYYKLYGSRRLSVKVNTPAFKKQLPRQSQKDIMESIVFQLAGGSIEGNEDK